MSLQVWLPLTKDLRQQGLSNIKVENHNATLNTAGKLGSCYYFNGSQQWLQFDTVLGDYYNNDWSIACWLKPTDSTRSVIISEYSSTGASNVGLELTTSRVVRLYWNGSPDINFTTAGALPINEWTHLTVTKQARIVKVYFNGELKQTYTNSSDFSTRTSASYPRIGDDYRGNSANTVSYQGYINDFRMYDHCLSPMEVKELAKGLVLHYPLNRNGWGQENLISNSQLNGSWTYPSSSYSDKYSPTTLIVPSGSVYTLSFDAKSTVNGDKIRTHYYSPNTTTTCTSNQGIVKTATDGNMDFTLTTSWKRYWVVYNQSETTAVKHIICPRLVSGNGTGTVSVKNVKFEEGSVATPWCPNSSDILATTIGLNSTTEYDCSGFCNNLNKNGTYSYTSDTPKYAVSTVFNGTEWMNGTTPGVEILTLACWAKTTKNKSTSQFMVADSTSGLCISFYSGTIISYFGSGSQSTGSKCTLGSVYKENDWNHFVVVKTGAGTRTVYCNGVEQTATSNDYWSAAGGLFIGSRNNSATLPFYGELCDVRAYATALSTDDVKSLYQNSAYIDNSGNVYGAVHMEV